MCFGSKAKLKKNPPPAPVPVSRPQGFNQWLESNPYYERPGAPKPQKKPWRHRGGHGPPYYSSDGVDSGGGSGGDGGGGGGGGDGGGCS